MRAALIAQALEPGGTLRLQRQFQEASQAHPALALEQILALLAQPDLATAGHQALERLAQSHIKVVTLLDSEYPLQLRQIPDPPTVLFFCGQIQTLHRPAIAIVGARKHSAYGGAVAASLAAGLARLGFVVVSGLARGIDTRAHAACLAAQGRTVAVLGTGVDCIYPNENRELARNIAVHGGVILSEFPPGTPVRPFHFPIRNRIISGLCHATIVVEANEKSGSLVTARHCLNQGRELFAVPGPIDRPLARGTNRLIANGEARLLMGVDDVLAELTPLLGMAVEHHQAKAVHIAHKDARRIYERLDAFECTPLDLLIAELELPAGEVVAHLVELETLGLVERHAGAQFLRNPLT